MNFQRDSLAIRNLTKLLIDNKKTFTIKHGTYTTTIETPHGKRKFQTNNFSQRVFIAARMIRKDVLNSEIGKEIMNRKHSKSNFGHHENLTPFKAKKVLNIDISSAYATCLIRSGLITQKTFDYISKLKKDERLPSIGMLARSQTVFVYKDGVCVEVEPVTADTAQVFFFLIEEINLIMESIAWVLGKHYFFYWVDGVFFSENTPKSLITQVEKILSQHGYKYKYECVRNFSLTKDSENLYTINMIKNDEPKMYQFSGQNTDGSQILRFLTSLSKSS